MQTITSREDVLFLKSTLDNVKQSKIIVRRKHSTLFFENEFKQLLQNIWMNFLNFIPEASLNHPKDTKCYFRCFRVNEGFEICINNIFLQTCKYWNKLQ